MGNAEHKITFNLDAYRNELDRGIQERLASLRNTLRSIEDGSYHEGRNTSAPGSVVSYSVASFTGDTTTLIQGEIKDTYIAITRTMYTFFEEVMAVKEFIAAGPTVIDREKTLDEAIEQSLKSVAEIATRIRHDQSISAPRKAVSLGPYSDFIEKTITGYIDLRNCLEHHDSVARREILLNTLRIEPWIDHRPITALPATVNKGEAVGVSYYEHARIIAPGERVLLSEAEVNEISGTIMRGIAGSIINNMLASKQSE